jgi:hypothetical protein
MLGIDLRYKKSLRRFGQLKLQNERRSEIGINLFQCKLTTASEFASEPTGGPGVSGNSLQSPPQAVKNMSMSISAKI